MAFTVRRLTSKSFRIKSSVSSVFELGKFLDYNLCFIKFIVSFDKLLYPLADNSLNQDMFIFTLDSSISLPALACCFRNFAVYFTRQKLLKKLVSSHFISNDGKIVKLLHAQQLIFHQNASVYTSQISHNNSIRIHDASIF